MNLFARLKDWRRIATRCDRCGEFVLSAICIALTAMICALGRMALTALARMLSFDHEASPVLDRSGIPFPCCPPRRVRENWPPAPPIFPGLIDDGRAMIDPGIGPRQRKLYLHIGLPKTASTWLQSEVFPKLDHVRVVEKPQTRLFSLPKDGDAGFGAFACALRRSATLWESYGDALFEEMLGPRSEWLAEDGDLVITDEAIGRAGSRPALLAAHVAGIAATAARWGLSRTCILCVIRRQDHWLASHYAQISDRMRRPGQVDFEMLISRVLDAAQSRHEFGTLLDFHLLREALVGAVGADSLLILAQEALRDEPEATLGQILAWLGASNDCASRIQQSALSRQANVRSHHERWRLRPPTLHVPGLARRVTLPIWLMAGHRQTISLKPELSAAILDVYSPGNCRLAAAGNLPLERWGYFGDPILAAHAVTPEFPSTRSESLAQR